MERPNHLSRWRTFLSLFVLALAIAACQDRTPQPTAPRHDVAPATTSALSLTFSQLSLDLFRWPFVPVLKLYREVSSVWLGYE